MCQPMTTFLFIHGASVREPHNSAEFEYIKNTLLSWRSDLIVERCNWGETQLSDKSEGAAFALFHSFDTVMITF